MSGGIVDEYRTLASEADADLLAMQVGDFYEFFGEDAETVAAELDLKLSEKGSAGDSHPMAGVPVDDLTPYVTRLVERGYRVAVADQHETADGHAREVDRVVTPGTSLRTSDAEARYLVAVVEDDEYGLAFADVTTGRFHVTTVPGTEAVLGECYRFDPVEVLPGPAVREGDLAERIAERADATVTDYDRDAFAPGAATHETREQFGDAAIESVGLESGDPAVRAAGAVLAYVEATGVGVRGSLTRLGTYRSDEGVDLDATTQRNLELTETMSGGSAGTLYDTVDHTVTAAGGRLLRAWLTRPRRDRAELERRLDGVAALADAPLARDALREELDGTRDLARLASRAAGGTADPGDLASIRDALGALPALREAVERAPELADSPVADVLDRPDREATAALRGDLDAALVADPPASTGGGELFRPGYDDDLDGLIERHEELRAWFDDLAARERDRLGVTHLQVDRNRTDGYYVQVGKSETDRVPEGYREIKTLKNSRRYTTDELADREREILRVEERRAALERDLFEALRDRVGERAELLQDVGRALAEVDALASLATHAVANDWVRPALHDGDGIDVTAGRHPVVERTVEFVPNDVRLGGDAADDRRFLVVTGPNMSGKSTYMRQAALIVLLAQAGSFVPAETAEIGLVDGIYTRVGALDELAGGRSTFMVEMQELSNILHSATEDSLVVLDEVGRGTATYDGISIAWAATEYLHNEIRAKTLFATHYHELTALADHLPRVGNVHVAVDGEPRSPSASGPESRPSDERDGEVTFLRTVREGPTDRSYGIHVADLAGVPEPVVDRSHDVLEKLREEKAVEARGAGGGEATRQAVFDLGSGQFRDRTSADGGTSDDRSGIDPEAEAVLDELAELPIHDATPIEVLSRVQSWQKRLDDG